MNNKEYKEWSSSTKSLTERQKEILSLLADGLQYREVANTLGISFYTVKNTVCAKGGKGILRRLGAKNLAHAVAIAVREGIIE